MGPSGSGKSAVGAALANRSGLRFIDADDLHPPENVAKMTAGVPLDDDDRMPWLDLVGAALAAHDDVVVACSALARRYRERILAVAHEAIFVELDVERAELERRMRARDHFMPPALLDSQLAVWEHLAADEPGVRVAVAWRDVDGVAAAAQAALDQSLR
ncbi:gluconokinase [Microbacterium fluvii]|uniref:Gluconokinase n=1 Tax=Microbacterium fluvii TaxID=415215 RepID=A0ABW2HCA5_9MICO|nr:gluconokinase, GntK/IdnK-type [Microbacterium fluvii]MCU4672366.1 gluconokinase, GntK/IdnK-type [Microbacterium fluvii]